MIYDHYSVVFTLRHKSSNEYHSFLTQFVGQQCICAKKYTKDALLEQMASICINQMQISVINGLLGNCPCIDDTKDQLVEKMFISSKSPQEIILLG